MMNKRQRQPQQLMLLTCFSVDGRSKTELLLLLWKSRNTTRCQVYYDFDQIAVCVANKVHLV